MSAPHAACRDAVAALDHALRDRPDRIYDDLVRAVRCVVQFRDALIEALDDTEAPPALADRLVRANAILSVLVGGEYPLAGLREDRIRNARDALRALLDETGRDAAQATPTA
jgi:hypothetical protein